MSDLPDPFIPATEKYACETYIGAKNVMLIEGENWLSSTYSVNTGDWV